MNICIFSKNQILYQSVGKGPLLAIAIPTSDQKREYADIPANASSRLIKERYGVIDGELLARAEGSHVSVYGQLPEELHSLRKEVKVYLPEDMLPLDVNVLYFVVGEGLIIHSVRHIDNNGNVIWNSILIKLEKQGAGITNIIENLVSERVVSNDDEKILVAYTGLSHEKKEDLYKKTNQFGLVIEPLEKLTSHKDKKPVYQHKDNSIFMMIIIIMAFILMGLSVVYYVTGLKNIGESKTLIKNLRSELRDSLSKRRLKKVSNPQQVKDSIEGIYRARPSAIIHSAAEVASLFGILSEVYLEKRVVDRLSRAEQNKPEDSIVYVIAKVKADTKALLLDQERLANSVYETRKWVRSIERSNQPGDDILVLKIGISVDNSGEL